MRDRLPAESSEEREARLQQMRLPVADITAPEHQTPVFTSLRRMSSLIGLLSSELFPVLPQGIVRPPFARVTPLN